VHRIFHIASRADWTAAKADGEYRISTLGRTLEDEGFIHCSTLAQVASYGPINTDAVVEVTEFSPERGHD
jgi:uncharacterized protein (DUF952 family)